MSSLSRDALHDGSGSSPVLPLTDLAEQPASGGGLACDGSYCVPVTSVAAAAGFPRDGASVEQLQRDELDRVLASAVEVGQLLIELGSDDVDRALAVIFAARSQLDRTERQLVRLARQTGQGWGQIGAALGVGKARATHRRFAGIR